MFKEYRILRKYTQLQLADLINKDIRTIQRIENNETIPTLETFAKLINILKIDNKVVFEYLEKIAK